ncbi:MAG: DNA mismatch repair protein, partial [Acidobacteriota bacterium]|nr:DNA mismatch repair protein [Acidobacteriota bacterium]
MSSSFSAGPTAARLQIPDLLHSDAHLVVDEDSLIDLLGLAFLGRDLGTALDDALAQAKLPRGSWNEEFFARDLFIDDFAKTCSSLTVDGATYPANQRFLRKVLANVPVDVETVRMRQGILRELLDEPDLRRRFEGLYKALFALTSLFGTPGYQGSLDTSAIHLEILRHSKAIIDRMVRDFGDANSGLRRLHECSVTVQESHEYQTLSDLLEYESGMAHLSVDIRLGGDGRIRRVRLDRLQEKEDNQFWTPPWQRFRNRLRFIAGGYDFTNKELMKRIVNQVFTELVPSLIPLIQLVGHLEFYLCSLKFRELARARGLEVCLADFNGSRPVQLEGLFNPLLLQQAKAPVPCSIRNGTENSIVLVTGPNSGGKTRLLQSLAWAAVLGQSGSFAPASAATLPMLNGLFVSLVENESADQTEGRLGRELVRIRSLFEQMRVGSMVVLDELCSGTNPSEGVEVFAMVLRLLDRVKPTAFVTTHFLDFARGLAETPPVPALEFLQVQLDEEQSSTYQFAEGVAPTSLAALTAARLGVTFERLVGHIV